MHSNLKQLTSVRSDLAVCWLGNLSWLIYTGTQLIAFDLDLDHDLRTHPSPIPTEEIAPLLKALFITHGHGDHFNLSTAAILAEQSNCLFVIPANCRSKARSVGVPDERIRFAHPREPFDLPGIHVEPLRALHGDRHQAVYRHANLEDCGYLVTMMGTRILQPGDSVLLQDHLELMDIDILFVSPTDHNMHIKPASILIQALQPKLILPQHFGTYQEAEDNLFWTRGYPDELRDVLPTALQARYRRLEQGEVFEIELPL